MSLGSKGILVVLAVSLSSTAALARKPKAICDPACGGRSIPADTQAAPNLPYNVCYDPASNR